MNQLCSQKKGLHSRNDRGDERRLVPDWRNVPKTIANKTAISPFFFNSLAFVALGASKRTRIEQE